MIRTTASRLKAKLGTYMKAVRAGKEVVVTDRSEPVARLIPFGRAEREPPRAAVSQARDPSAPPLGEVQILGIHYRGRNTMDILLEDRTLR